MLQTNVLIFEASNETKVIHLQNFKTMYIKAIDNLLKRTIQVEVDSFFPEPDGFVIEGIYEGEHARLSSERYTIISIKDDRDKNKSLTTFESL